MTNHISAKSIGQLAIKVFSITPHSADCERVFSALGWLYSKRRQKLSLSRIQAIPQIRSFYISNIKNKLAFFGKTLLSSNLKELVVAATFLVES
ncbi:2323_t:CDS:1, partial [Scutellospora calospora]